MTEKVRIRLAVPDDAANLEVLEEKEVKAESKRKERLS